MPDSDDNHTRGVPAWVGMLSISLLSVFAGGMMTAAIQKFSSDGNDLSSLQRQGVEIKAEQKAFREMFIEFCRQMEKAQAEKKATDEWQTRQIYKLLNHANLSH